MKLSVLIPVYNEERTLEEVVRRVRSIELPKEIILVDDGSKDRSREILTRLQEETERAPDPLNELKVFLQPHNQGKGRGDQSRLGSRARRGHNHSGRRSRVRPARLSGAVGTHRARSCRRGLWNSIRRGGRAPRIILLALVGQSDAHVGLEHADQLEPFGYGSGLQDVSG